MVAIPAQPAVTAEEMSQWYAMQEQLKKLKASEMLLRQRIFGSYFPDPSEGTNTAPLSDGWVLKGGYKIERKLDVGALGAMREQFTEAGISVDALVEYKPELRIKPYRELTAEQMALFDRCLIIKPGAPSLSVELPAKARKEQAPPAAITVQS